MTTVTVSSKYQIVIPKEIRQAMDLRPGQKLQVVLYEGRGPCTAMIRSRSH